MNANNVFGNSNWNIVPQLTFMAYKLKYFCLKEPHTISE
nr:MAG TPA: hypothetical protein [Caudoviricetes sp.]